MKKVNSKLFIALGLLIIVIAIIFTEGITFGIGGKFYFTTKYYKTAAQAFSSEYTNAIEINNQLDIVQIDDENCLFLAVTKDGKLLIAPMICKNKKFAYMGDHTLYDSESTDDYTDNDGFIKNTISLYHNGKATDNFDWAIVFKEEIPLENYDCKKYAPENFRDFKLVFFN